MCLIALLAPAESAAFVGLIVPGEAALLVGGFLAYQGRVSLALVLVVAVAGAITRDSIGYKISRLVGPRLRRSRLGRRVGDPDERHELGRQLDEHVRSGG